MRIQRLAAFSLALMLGVMGARRAQADFLDKLKTAVKVGETAAKANAHIDDRQERSIGRAVTANLVARFGLVEDPELTAYVSKVGNVVASQSSRPELPYRFGILDTDEVNAFAGPGGYVLISRGTLAQAWDESELAGVLAHEIVHLAERHGVKAVEATYRRKVVMEGLTEAAASRTGADPRLVAAFDELTDELTDVLLTKGLSRQQELDADHGALELVAASGYDPEGLVRFLQRLADGSVSESRMKTLARTHPAPADRVSRLEGAMSEERIQPHPEARWRELFIAATESTHR